MSGVKLNEISPTAPVVERGAGPEEVGRFHSAGDVRMLVPVSNFAGASQSDFVYLFSRFGDNNANNDGYEEWNLQGGGTATIPLPAAGAMGLAGLIGVGGLRRRKTS